MSRCMAAPKGNKNGVGHGRPPNEGFDDDSLAELGKELIAWTKEMDAKKQKIVHLSDWYAEIKEISRTQWDSIIRRDSFIGYYERASLWMGRRILKGGIETSYGNRFLTIYFKELREHEREKKREEIDYEIEKKAEIDKRASQHPNDDRLAELIRSIKENK